MAASWEQLSENRVGTSTARTVEWISLGPTAGKRHHGRMCTACRISCYKRGFGGAPAPPTIGGHHWSSQYAVTGCLPLALEPTSKLEQNTKIEMSSMILNSIHFFHFGDSMDRCSWVPQPVHSTRSQRSRYSPERTSMAWSFRMPFKKHQGNTVQGDDQFDSNKCAQILLSPLLGTAYMRRTTWAASKSRACFIWVAEAAATSRHCLPRLELTACTIGQFRCSSPCSGITFLKLTRSRRDCFDW